jgi:LacI family transcriptional regulator, gluconate utilization system Gnt-I transcriptional repressor
MGASGMIDRSQTPRHRRAGRDGKRPSAGSAGTGALRAHREARMSDVARLADVSTMTVSRALRHPDIVDSETLKRIQAAIKTTGYLPNRVAGSLASQHSNVVGLIVPSLRNSLFAETIKGVADTLGDAYALLIADSGYALDGEEAAVAAFLSQRVCGIVLHNTKHTARTRRLILTAAIPCVETGNLVRRPIDMAASFSNHNAAFEMTAHLIAKGYRRIGFVSLPLKDNDRARERQSGYLDALGKHGIAVDRDIVLESAPGLRGGAEALRQLMQKRPKIDAVFLTGDVLATGALLEANRRGWRVPDDIAIAGSDDNELQESVSPPLTSLRFPRYDIGCRAATMLLDRIAGVEPEKRVVDLGFQIILRHST